LEVGVNNSLGFAAGVWAALGVMTSVGGCSAAKEPGAAGVGREAVRTTAQRLALGPVNVLTNRYDNQRTGANLLETVLTTSNVPGQLGELFTLPVDDQIYAQPLYASQLAIAGGTHDVLFVATMNNSVYAFDADVAGPPLWQASFNGSGVPVRATQVGQACGTYRDVSGNIGIVGTPVIDPDAGTMYVVARTFESGLFVQRLHAIDITTGADRAGSPVDIQATVQGSGEGSDGNGNIPFNTQTENQRAALALSQGTVFIAWASHCDTSPYHGWVMAYDAASLAQIAAFNDTASGGKAGIWQAGSGPVIDPDGNVYYATGNGDWDGTQAFGESVVQLSPQNLAVTDYFTAFDWDPLNRGDQDLGSTGPMLFPGTNLLVTGSKAGKLYVIDRTNMGGMNGTDDSQLPQWFQATAGSPTHHIHGGEVAWSSNPAGSSIYVWGENDFLREFSFQPDAGAFNTTPVVGPVRAPQGMPGGMLALSANGGAAGTGIVWASLPLQGDANQAVVQGVLRAFDAASLTELWNSTLSAGDVVGDFAKFVPPTVANGKVYLATFSGRVNVYGLR
jgi:hypothetical protein